MNDDLAISVEGVSKKYCKNLRRSMRYGLADVGRNLFGIRSPSERLRRDEFWAVEDVSLDIARGESVGLIGPNGSGKTTLLKMINGIFWPDRGRIQVRGKVGALIAVGAGFHPLLTGRENIYVNGAILGMSREDIDRNYDSIVEFAEIGDFLDTPVKHYSSGMFVRLGFAVAVHCEPDVMLVDEVLAVGDRGFQTKCFRKMGELKESGTTFLIVSHNMHTIAGFVDWVAVLHEGRAARYEVFEGIERYESLFRNEGEDDIERLVSGGEHVAFDDVQIGTRQLSAGDSFTVDLGYDCSLAYEDVELDIVVYDARDHEIHFQATNRAFDAPLSLSEGRHRLKVRIDSMRVNGSPGTVALSLWSKGRKEQLFWWRIPVQFARMPGSTGRTFLPVHFESS